MKSIIIRTVIMLTFFSVAACGNKGDLFLEEKPATQTAEEPTKPTKK